MDNSRQRQHIAVVCAAIMVKELWHGESLRTTALRSPRLHAKKIMRAAPAQRNACASSNNASVQETAPPEC